VSVFDASVRSYMPPASARTHLFRALHTLGSLRAFGASDLDRALEHYAAVAHGPGLVTVLSDFFVDGAGLRGLQALLHRDLVPAIVQVVANEELHPNVDDGAELFDVEHPEGSTLAVDAAGIASYRARIANQQAVLREFSARHRCPYLQVTSGATLEAMLGAAEAAGLLSAVV
jgi:hypothetical protein